MLRRVSVAALLLAAIALPQSLTFDAASIKPSSSTFAAGADNPTTYSAHHARLRDLIAKAFDLSDYQIAGGPDWVNVAEFDLDARTADPATPKEKLQMLAALLADRFHLTFHRETRTLRAYAMLVGKDGPKIHPAKEDAPKPSPRPGLLVMRMDMPRLATLASLYIQHNMTFPAPGTPPMTPPEPLPVVDQTGLTGEYDVSLDFTKINDWFVVLEQQLGLKLESRKVPIEMLIIDSASKPSGN